MIIMGHKEIQKAGKEENRCCKQQDRGKYFTCKQKDGLGQERHSKGVHMQAHRLCLGHIDTS